jgi:hypothetical protein
VGTTGPPRRRGRILAGLAAFLLVATLAFVAIRVATSGGGAVSADLGNQSDPAAVGRVVEAALSGRGEAAVPSESGSRCASETRGTYGQGLGSLVYTARLRWQGVPAMALTYRTAEAAAANLDHRVFVVSTDDCQLLLAQGL